MADSIVLDFILRAQQQGVDGAAAAVGELNKQYDQNQKATAGAKGGQDNLNKSLQHGADSASSLRYANYDLARTLLSVSAAMAAVGVAAVAAFASQESAFTEVERIISAAGATRPEIQALRDDLVDLSEEIPKSFSDLSQIAAFGAALDIPSEALADFSDVVARFSTLTGTTLEASGKGLARIAQYTKVPQEGFENLGSAILRAGNISIATEDEVLRFSQAIAPLGSRSEVTADQIIAMSAATASFTKINVEGAGSAFSRVFAQIDRATATGGPKLEAFARTAGMSADEFTAAWDSKNGGAGSTFNQVIEGMAGSSEKLALQLDNLNIRNVRDRRIIEGLVLNYEKYKDIQGETTQAFQDGTALGDAYAFVLDDVATKFQLFINNAQNAGAAIGSAFAPAVGDALDILSDLLGALRDFADSAGGRVFFTLAGTVGALVASWAAVRGAIALATAATLGFRAATAAAGSASLASGLAGLATAAGGVGTDAGKAAGSMGLLAGAAGNVGKAVGGFVKSFGGIGVVLGVAVAGFSAFMGELKRIEDVRIADLSSQFSSVGLSAEVMYENVRRTFAGNIDMSGFEGALGRQAELFERNNLLVGEQEALFGTNIDTLNAAGQAATDFGDILNKAVEADPEGGLARSQAYLRAYRDEFHMTSADMDAFLNGPGKEYRDYLAGQLEANNQAATSENLRSAALGEGTAATRLATGAMTDWEAQAIAAADAAEQAQTEFDELKQAFLDIGSSSMNAQAAQDAAQTSLNNLKETAKEFTGDLQGTSAEAINFREQIRQLENDNRLAAVATLENGQATAATREQYAKAREELVKQITPFFESEKAARKYADTVLGSSEESVSAIEEVGAQLKILGDTEAEPEINVDNSDAKAKVKESENDIAKFAGKTATATININAQTNFAAAYANISALNRAVAGASGRADLHYSTGGSGGLTFATGGYTGRGGKYTPAGIVHKGEYVIPKHLVNQATGLPNADALGKLVRGAGGPGYAQGGFVRDSQPAFSGTVSLSAGTIQQIARAVQHVTMLDSQTIAGAVASQNVQSSLRGAS